MIPKLQIALDHSDLASAITDVAKIVDVVDVLEVGTVLCLQEGAQAIKCVRALAPNKPVVADTKCADAGGTVAKNCKEAGADIMTVICCAEVATMQAAAQEIAEIQVELYGDWTFTQAQTWLDVGIDQAVYHQSRDALLAGETWGQKDLEKVQKLIDMGFKVSVTGGLSVDILQLFAGVAVDTFIAGRGITAAKNPRQAAEDFKAEIKRIWK